MSSRFEDQLREDLRELSIVLPERANPYARITAAVAADRRRRRTRAAAGTALAFAATLAIGGAVVRGMPSAELSPGGPRPEPTSTPTGTFRHAGDAGVVIESCLNMGMDLGIMDAGLDEPLICTPELESRGLANFRAAVAATTNTPPDSIEAEVSFNQTLPESVLPAGGKGYAMIYQTTLPSGKHIRATDAFVSNATQGVGGFVYLHEVESLATPVIILPTELGANATPILIAPEATTVRIAPSDEDLDIEVRDAGEGVWSLQWPLPEEAYWYTVLHSADVIVTSADGTEYTFPGPEILDP